MPTWSSAGYDMFRADRCLYLFLDWDGFHTDHRPAVKLGLVLEPGRVEERRRRVSKSKRYERKDLRCVATHVLPGVTHATAEHIEAAARHWLCNAYNFEHAGLVDWLIVPEPAPTNWQALLDEASRAAMNFGLSGQ